MSLPEATTAVLQLIGREPCTIEQIAVSARINRRTVVKVLDLVDQIQKFTQKAALETIDVHPKKRLVRLVKKDRAFSSLPSNLQKFIIRSAFFPTASREEEILTYLYIHRAFSPRTAISLEPNQIVRKLTQQGQLAKSRNRVYLSEEGRIVAEGGLQLYPEVTDSIVATTEIVPTFRSDEWQITPPKLDMFSNSSVLKGIVSTISGPSQAVVSEPIHQYVAASTSIDKYIG